MNAVTPFSTDSLVVYGFGGFGKELVDALIAEDVAVDLILDRTKRGGSYRDIPIIGLEDVTDGRLAGRPVVIGLHNHYVDIHEIHGALRSAGASPILTPTHLAARLRDGKPLARYWLDPAFDYAKHEAEFAGVHQLLADERSRSLFEAILRYRRNGDILDCPVPSLDDEYTPKDLPRYAGPLKVIDCGAFTGVAIHKLLKAGYPVESFVAFEPDLENFALLARRNFPVARALCLPLGTWSSTRQLSFASEGSMGSCLSESGATTVQCVAIDDVLHGEEVNLVKLDVEGAEIETLNGMERLIRAQRPNLLLSVYHTPGHLYEIAELVSSWQLGYRFHLRVHEHSTFGVVLYCLQDHLLEN